MATCITRSPEETFELGRQWARSWTPGTVVAVSGDLGAGKTQLIKGVAAGLGCRRRVQSPTFALVNEYRELSPPLFHLDLYRLESPAAIVAAGLEEYLTAPAGVALVEWPERWFGDELFALDPGPAGDRFQRPAVAGVRRVVLTACGETERRMVYEDSGD